MKWTVAVTFYVEAETLSEAWELVNELELPETELVTPGPIDEPEMLDDGMEDDND